MITWSVMGHRTTSSNSGKVSVFRGFGVLGFPGCSGIPVYRRSLDFLLIKSSQFVRSSVIDLIARAHSSF